MPALLFARDKNKPSSPRRRGSSAFAFDARKSLDPRLRGDDDLKDYAREDAIDAHLLSGGQAIDQNGLTYSNVGYIYSRVERTDDFFKSDARIAWRRTPARRTRTMQLRRGSGLWNVTHPELGEIEA
ncbi:hypothetical protein [Pseudoxanthomonas sp. CF125]|uniref:hypothetical protein n=1 Tax=Pseudoxanthomonas sp. CF125 TaxID=1855303 RepID=UPI000B817F32|nr:hypothetical protein [Pseudoxanthomonas sp. CF125]